MSPGPSVHDPGKNGENKEDEMESMEAPPGNIGVAGNSSEEEEPSDEMPHSVMGYELLSQGVDFPDEDSDDDDDDDDSEDDNNMADVEAYVSCQQNFTFVDEKDVVSWCTHFLPSTLKIDETNWNFIILVFYTFISLIIVLCLYCFLISGIFREKQMGYGPFSLAKKISFDFWP